MMNAETTSTLSSLPEMITRMSADLIMSEKYGSSSMGGKKSWKMRSFTKKGSGRKKS